MASIFQTMNQQSNEACDKVKNHKIFGNTQFNVVGLSQGALIARYIVESCDTKFPVRNLLTVGGPNNGIDFQEECMKEKNDNLRCLIQNKFLGLGNHLNSPYSLLL